MPNEDELNQKENPSGANYDQRLEVIRQKNVIDAKFGYQLYTEYSRKNAWLVNVQQAEILDETTKTILAALDLYFLEECGNRFKISYAFRPYLYLETIVGNEYAIAAYLSRKYHFVLVEHVEKENLDLKNHLSGLKSKFLRVSFPSTVEMSQFKKEIMPQIRKNRKALEKSTEYTTLLSEYMRAGKWNQKQMNEDGPLEQIIDIREYDLPFDMRVCIDKQLFVGHWYVVIGRDPSTQSPSIRPNTNMVEPSDPLICAFDIETTKAPLKFPEPTEDQIMMISYMIDGHGFLIVNRQIVAADIDDFEYTPRPEFQGEFHIFNELDERATLLRFFDHLLRVKPAIMVTYNGDFFDWPFVDARAQFHGISLANYLGFYKDAQSEYKHNNCIHMDAFKWVQRDSYLPMGSQSLKAATREKLRYDPVELDPEEMVTMARQQPKLLASYSVSDAVATYYLYTKYVHPFIFALCTIIPLSPDDVLRKGSGTLCEALLMVQAYQNNIIFPNKQIAKEHRFTQDGHLIDNETYVGGHVEAVESGVFRADIACRFKLDVSTLEELKADVRPTIEHSLLNDAKCAVEDVADFEQICGQIEDAFDELIDRPIRTELPKLYHLDVGAMYPNIILTNRLQPPAVVAEEDCMACIHNAPDAKCKREMNWVWRGEIIPAKKGEFDRLMQQLEQEKFGKPPKPFSSQPMDERAKIAKKRIHEYCKTAYKRLHDTREEQRSTTICQREHSFYVDTVRAFRDRRYEYKEMHKKAKAALDAVPADDLAGKKMAQSRVVLYDSLQLAHKCILNSFYGYVMRKGSRWFSMEMAGIVCHTGANIITEARQLIERIGRPLELDTDGIWCLLPASFPDTYIFHSNAGKVIKISYPGAMLNALVKDRFTNDQYHNVDLASGECRISSENSIFFEVDGPYYAMILPASKEEGKKLKKRYAVFNFDKTLAELKGFEVKRRGELAIIKYFQTEVFKAFLKGTTLQEIYENVGKEANYWLSILYDKGQTLTARELFELIGESKNMSRQLDDYGDQKSTSITTAKRLAEFLGEGMVKNKGLACKFIVSRFPFDEPVTERTIPQAIFEAEPRIRIHYLRKWTNGAGLDFASETCLRELIDWTYYIERLNSCIQKIVTIPASFQGLPNPVPRVPHPQWLENKRKERIEMTLQPRITDIFKTVDGKTPTTRIKPGLSPWSLKKSATSNTPTINDGGTNNRKRPAVNAEDTPIMRPKENANSKNKTLAVKRICIVKSTSEEQMEKENELINNGKEDDNQAVGPELITLDELEKAAENKKTNDSTKTKTTKIISKKTLQREAKQRAIAQHAKRRIQRQYYDEEYNKLVKKTWKDDGFHKWFAFLKAKWRLQKEAKWSAFNAEIANELAENGGENVSGTTTTIKSSKQREQIWLILQILETKIPGQFTVFALVDGSILRRINLAVPRTIYVDDIEPRQTAAGRLSQKLLPRMRPSAYLYEFPIDEALFAKRMADLNMQKCLMRINGVYETKIPLLFKAILSTGVCCHIGSQRNPSELTLDTITRFENYSTDLARQKQDFERLRLFFFYEYAQAGRSVFALFMPKLERAALFVLNRSSVDLMNLDSLYKNELNRIVRQKTERGEEFPELDECKMIEKVDVIQSSSMKDASRRLQTLINGLKLAPSDPILLCLQSNRQNSHQLFKDFPSLRAFPAVFLRTNEPPNLMNLLDWANSLARRSIQHFFNSFTFLKQYWSMSAYMEIPIGNLPEDVPLFALDAIFARQLQSKNHILWASPSSVPDFGGKDLEDLRLSNDWNGAAFTQQREHLINKETFEAKSITAELSLGAIAVTALLQSARISEAEGTTEHAGFSAQIATLSIEDAISHRFGGLTKYDDAMAISGELRCLREVFHRLVKDIHYQKNVVADQLVVNLNRWINDTNALMFNPAIRNALSTLMRKICLLLVAEIQRLGGTVIHCSFNRLILSTNRPSLQLARAFLDSLLLALSQKQMFASFQLNVRHCSSLLLWIDSSNYARVLASDDPAKNGRVDAHFSMATRLPEAVGIRKNFDIMVAGFMGMLSKKRNEFWDKEEEFNEDAFNEYGSKILSEEIMESLFKLASRLVAARSRLQKLANELGCPDIPLEFVQCACRVLSVNTAIEEQVDRIRHQLMLIIQQDDTVSKNAISEWIPPSRVVLENVFCPNCLQSADLDVNQEEQRRAPTEQQQSTSTIPTLPFACPHCRAEYPMSLVEELLIERISKMQMAFVLQDWRCQNCKKIGANFLSRHCECNNPFEGTIRPEEFKQNLCMVKRVATKHGLINLEHALDHISLSYQIELK